MSKFEERTIDEVRSWLDESTLAREFLEHVKERRGDCARGMITAVRDANQNAPQRFLGAHDELTKLIYMLERTGETKR